MQVLCPLSYCPFQDRLDSNQRPLEPIVEIVENEVTLSSLSIIIPKLKEKNDKRSFANEVTLASLPPSMSYINIMFFSISQPRRDCEFSYFSSFFISLTNKSVAVSQSLYSALAKQSHLVSPQ